VPALLHVSGTLPLQRVAPAVHGSVHTPAEHPMLHCWLKSHAVPDELQNSTFGPLQRTAPAVQLTDCVQWPAVQLCGHVCTVYQLPAVSQLSTFVPLQRTSPPWHAALAHALVPVAHVWPVAQGTAALQSVQPDACVAHVCCWPSLVQRVALSVHWFVHVVQAVALPHTPVGQAVAAPHTRQPLAPVVHVWSWPPEHCVWFVAHWFVHVEQAVALAQAPEPHAV
jgi:hypothetical protein